MTTLKLADLRYEDALALLVLRKQALDSGAIARLSKQAMDQTHWLTNTGLSYEKKALDSNLQNALIGAGVGGGIGGLGNLAFGNKSKRKINRFLEGGLAGAGLGGGLGMLYNPAMAAANNVKPDKEEKPPLSSNFSEESNKNLQNAQAYALAHPEDTAYTEKTRNLTNESKQLEQQGFKDIAGAGLLGGVGGGGLYRSLGGAASLLEKDKTVEEVAQDLAHKATTGLRSQKNQTVIDQGKLDEIVNLATKAQEVRKRVDPNYVPFNTADLRQVLTNTVNNHPDPVGYLQQGFSDDILTKKTLKDQAFRKTVIDSLSDSPDKPYTMTKSIVNKPSANSVGRVGLLTGLGSATAELLGQLRRQSDMDLKRVELAGAMPGYKPVEIPSAPGFLKYLFSKRNLTSPSMHIEPGPYPPPF